jgi:membrane-associated HD superfamily phosphohydrolase
MKTMNRTLKLLIIISIFTFSACTPMTKEQYIEDYDDFIAEVSANHSDYTQKDWHEIDKKFEKFDNEWHSKFKEDFTVKDRIKLNGYKLRYNSMKLKKQFFKASEMSYDIIKKEIEYYIENDLNEDLEQMQQEASKLSDTLVDMMDDIIKELQENNK